MAKAMRMKHTEKKIGIVLSGLVIFNFLLLVYKQGTVFYSPFTEVQGVKY